MPTPRSSTLLALLVLTAGPSLRAQGWNDPGVMALVARAIDARARAEPDSTLTSYRTEAHGFLFFLGQAGEELADPPRLIKADELDVEVYWRAPATSKQVIRGWRDGRWLPTDIRYHRDHLGIVTNNFGDRIRLGEGDEVRDVPHPLSRAGPTLYDYRLGDSLRLATRDTVLRLREVEVRPKDGSRPRVIGTLSIDQASGALVQFRFSFTRAAYLDGSLEDISVRLENARVEERWWLPWRQEVEIRRRLTWLDLPARSIIRGRWEIGEYQLNAPFPAALLVAPAIGGLTAPADSTGPWSAPLADLVRQEARPIERADLEPLRREVVKLAGDRLVSGLPRAGIGVGSVSELIHVNRVQGLALGGGLTLRPGRAWILRPGLGVGTSDGRLTGGLALEHTTAGGAQLRLEAGRTVSDFADRPIISGVVNSILSQEGGRDYGDYVRLDRAMLGLTIPASSHGRLRVDAGVEHSASVSTEASPASGRYRPNPPLGAGTIVVGRLGWRERRAAVDRDRSLEFAAQVEGGTGDRDYLRGAVTASLLHPLGPGGLSLAGEAGAGSSALPAYRSFAIGGWGTLPGEPFRAWGGRRIALVRLEYRLGVPVPVIPLGPWADTGPRAVLAPFLAAGWAGGGLTGLPWRPTHEARTVAGVGLELFHRLLRVETGLSLRTGHAQVTVDVGREWWEIL